MQTTEARRKSATFNREYRVLRVQDVMNILDVSQSKAYQIMVRINKELEAEGYETIAGRVSEARFWEKFYTGRPGERSGRSAKPVA